MPNKLVQAAAEGLPKFTRRIFLGSAAAASFPVAATALVVMPKQRMSIDEFLAEALPSEKVRYHSNALADAMAEMHPEHLGWRVHADHEVQFVLVVPTTTAGIHGQDTGREEI